MLFTCKLCIYSSGCTVRLPLKHLHHLPQGLVRNQVARRNHWKWLALHQHHPGFHNSHHPISSVLLSDCPVYYSLWSSCIMDNHNLISFVLLAKNKRQLEPSRNKALINLMTSQLLAVLILGYEYLVDVWFLFLFLCLVYIFHWYSCTSIGRRRTTALCPQGRERSLRSSTENCTGRRRKSLSAEGPSSEKTSRSEERRVGKEC